MRRFACYALKLQPLTTNNRRVRFLSQLILVELGYAMKRTADNSIHLAQVVQAVSTSSRNQILSSGLGLEGFVKKHNDVLQLERSGNQGIIRFTEKGQKLFDESLRRLSQPSSGETFGQSSTQHFPGESSPSSEIFRDSPIDEKNPERAALLEQTLTLLPGPGVYVRINELYLRIFGSVLQKMSQAEFSLFLRDYPVHLLVRRSTVARKGITGDGPPKPIQSALVGKRTSDMWWSNAEQRPTREDVYEILKFVPIHWTLLSNLAIPAETKKRHIRISSTLTWIARQPRFFELRYLGGTTDVRRAVILHPDAHKISREEAEKYVADRISTDEEAGEPIILKAIRDSGLRASLAATTPTIGHKTQRVDHTGSLGTPYLDNVGKLLLRVCSAYYITAETLIRRSTKFVTLNDLVDVIKLLPQQLECLSIDLPSTSGMVHTLPYPAGKGKRVLVFFRRKVGSDQHGWTATFREDLCSEMVEDNAMKDSAESIAAVMSCMSSQWDRIHFVYVLMSDRTRELIGGFDEMVALMRRHPHIFRVGQYFCRRVDPSQRFAMDEEEPTTSGEVSTRILEDNPYHSQLELARIFQYLTPEDTTQSVTLAHFVDNSSPAMKSVLPPRVLTLIQQHSDLFTVREDSSGSFQVSRAVKARPVQTLKDSSGSSPAYSDQQLADVIAARIPHEGIDLTHLTQSLTPEIRLSLNRLFGPQGVVALASRFEERFAVKRNPPYTTLFLK